MLGKSTRSSSPLTPKKAATEIRRIRDEAIGKIDEIRRRQFALIKALTERLELEKLADARRALRKKT